MARPRKGEVGQASVLADWPIRREKEMTLDQAIEFAQAVGSAEVAESEAMTEAVAEVDEAEAIVWSRIMGVGH